jgi:hypothetical protein
VLEVVVTNPEVPVTYLVKVLGERLVEVTARLESAVADIKTGYVRRDLYDEKMRLIEERDRNQSAEWSSMHAGLEKRISDLEDDKKWLTRVILTFIVMGILGAVFVTARVGGA